MEQAQQDSHPVDEYELRAETLSERILLLMRRRGLNQKQLAALAGVHENTVANYLNAEKPEVVLKSIHAIAKALGVTVDYLLGGLTTRVLLQSPRQLPLMAPVPSPIRRRGKSGKRPMDRAGRGRASSVGAASSPKR